MHNQHYRRRARRLLPGVPLAAAMLASAGAGAQTLPDGCSLPEATDNSAFSCVSDGVLPGVETTANNVTLSIGSFETPTSVVGLGDGVSMTGDGPLNFSLLNSASSIEGGINGLDLFATGGGGGLNIFSEGSILGQANGIFADQRGTSSLNITVAGVEGVIGTAIRAFNDTSGTDLNVTASGLVSGNGAGISAENQGTGSLTIFSTNVMASADDSVGIDALNGAAGRDLTIHAGSSVTGGGTGINAVNESSGALTIFGEDVSGERGVGISARNEGGDLSIFTSGTVSGGDMGILARNNGEGTLSVGAGRVRGSSFGIDAENQGTGALSVDAREVTATNGTAVRAVNGENGTDLAVRSSSLIEATRDGIVADNRGSASLAVTVNDVRAGDTAIRVTVDRGLLNITTNGDIFGNDAGIDITDLNSDGTATRAVSVQAGSTVDGGNVAIRMQDLGGEGIDLQNRGTIGSSVASRALETGAGADFANNEGTLLGSLDLGGGFDHVSNANGGVFAAGETVFLGADVNAEGHRETFSNTGTFLVGGTFDAPSETLLTGNFVHSGTGTLLFDAFGDNQSDTLFVDGDAVLDANVSLLIDPFATLEVGTFFDVVEASGSLTLGHNFDPFAGLADIFGDDLFAFSIIDDITDIFTIGLVSTDFGTSLRYEIVGDLTAPVPLPAAAWLMVSGLLGGAAFRRFGRSR